MKKRVLQIKCDEAGSAELLENITGHIEKIVIFYSTDDTGGDTGSDTGLKKPDLGTELLIESDAGEQILNITGNEDKVFYPSSVFSSITGGAVTFDNDNPVPRKFFVEALRINIANAGPNAVIEYLAIYWEEVFFPIEFEPEVIEDEISF